MSKYDELSGRVEKLESGIDKLDPEKTHKFRVEYLIIGGGFLLIYLCLRWGYNIATNSTDTEFIKAFMTMSQSAAMLILGYLFGTRTNNN